MLRLDWLQATAVAVVLFAIYAATSPRTASLTIVPSGAARRSQTRRYRPRFGARARRNFLSFVVHRRVDVVPAAPRAPRVDCLQRTCRCSSWYQRSMWSNDGYVSARVQSPPAVR